MKSGLRRAKLKSDEEAERVVVQTPLYLGKMAMLRDSGLTTGCPRALYIG